mmetsp:Transcript_16350/g.31762  ORF Transcript_16350/g.31762 Transcript_16350/m.31762 type:complete len:485 (+) Transcript_16350:667-2121(+)|eukprot:CAMPEP_0171489694 /NCGR_PEP_ID=MMETSP0958-20121227/2906_1 /TAXON_ID=87120 /ORGANISM="Aurantiochytrium limacinum, Strain ATCCMYA-1381" /LENGTH=484 /DNA_ID=CAMNT_0012022949 /DNA_START=549 /DNA_END=2003 /DNA_ORIENTATION=+
MLPDKAQNTPVADAAEAQNLHIRSSGAENSGSTSASSSAHSNADQAENHVRQRKHLEATFSAPAKPQEAEMKQDKDIIDAALAAKGVVWSRDSDRARIPMAGLRVPISEVKGNTPYALRHVKNLNELPANITSVQEITPNTVVFYPGEFDGELVYHTRHHRKNRFPMIEVHDEETYIQRHMWTILTIEPDNISWWVAHVFTWGSILWVINAVYLMWPVESERNDLLITSVSGFFGGLVFEVGAYFSILEAINPRRHLEFGYRVADMAKNSIHKDKKNILHLIPHQEDPRRKWKWFAMEFSDAGTKAASVQMIGATLFTVAVVLALPNRGATDTILPSERFILADVFIWGFQVLGSFCFIYAGVILMLETQYRWFLPNLGSLGWWANFFNTIGGIGFLLCAVFGLLANVNGEEVCCQYYGTYLSTFWGSIAFLLGSIVMVIEVANKHPHPAPEFLMPFTHRGNEGNTGSNSDEINGNLSGSSSSG